MRTFGDRRLNAEVSTSLGQILQKTDWKCWRRVAGPSGGSTLRTVGVDMHHRIAPAVDIDVRPVDQSRRIATRPAGEPGGVVPGAVVIEPAFLVALLARKAIALWRLHGTSHRLIGGAAVRCVLLI